MPHFYQVSKTTSTAEGNADHHFQCSECLGKQEASGNTNIV